VRRSDRERRLPDERSTAQCVTHQFSLKKTEF